MPKSLYPNIEAERVRNGFTLEEISKKIGISRKTFYNWVTNGKIPQKKLESLSDLFGVSVEYLLQGPTSHTSAQRLIEELQKMSK